MTNGRNRPDRPSTTLKSDALESNKEALEYLYSQPNLGEVFKIDYLRYFKKPIKTLFKESSVIMDGDRYPVEHYPYIALACGKPDIANECSRSLKDYVTFCISIQHTGDTYSVDTVHRRYSEQIPGSPDISLPREDIHIEQELGLALGKLIISSAIIEGHPLKGIVRGHKKASAH